MPSILVVSNGSPLCPLLHDHLPCSSPVLHCSQGLPFPQDSFQAFTFDAKKWFLSLICLHSILATKVMPNMCLALGISPTLFTFSFVCLITSIWSWGVIPETRGLTLTQVNHAQWALPTIPIIKCFNGFFSSIQRCSAFHACKNHLDITVLLRKKGNSRRTRGRGEPTFLLFSFKSCSISRMSSNCCDI